VINRKLAKSYRRKTVNVIRRETVRESGVGKTTIAVKALVDRGSRAADQASALPCGSASSRQRLNGVFAINRKIVNTAIGITGALACSTWPYISA
jgi:hypothetical protein